ncbi:hypothetical protein WAF17_03905 [Bernardetia sp. ABR2-2B]|uniref:hypothetical protein n=1 Tax=Bernardetia sp. ABR2-2B TaxID=3127472 RepID=UPI0030CF6787
MQQTSQLLRGNYHYNRNAYIATGEPMIFHCHHYNVYLQAVIEDTSSYLNVYPILSDSSQEIAHTQFSNFFKEKDNQELSIEDKKQICQDYFRFCGFGIIDLSNLIKEGGKVDSPSEHYGIGWKIKFGLREKNKKGVAFFAAGYIAGAAEAIFDLPLGTLQTEQKECISQGDPKSSFEVFIRKSSDENQTNLISSPQEGKYQTAQLNQPSDTTIDYDGIRQALTNMDLQGDSKTGLIDAFGVLLTRMYANYYCLISYKLLKLFEDEMGDDGLPLAAQLLTEAGHICAYNTFGGVMQSTEWNAMIKPMIQNKEDWVHGITAVVNAFGWGVWEIQELASNQKLKMKIVSGYEPNNYLAHFDSETSLPVSFLASGGVAGIMNLVYNTALTEGFITLDENEYKKLVQNASFFQTQKHICRVREHSQFDQITVG